MLLLMIIFLLTVIFSILINKTFNRLKLLKPNYNQKNIPCSGGTIIFISILAGYFLYYKFNKISFFKLGFFSLIIFSIYMIGLLDDMFGESTIKGFKNIITACLHGKFPVGIVRIVGILIVASYLYYFFNEEHWIIKGVLTSIVANYFSMFDLKPGRCIKVSYLIYLVLSFGVLRWTNELFFISFSVLSAYYFFDAFGYSMLGESGSNIVGFMAGLMLTEAFSTNFIVICGIVLFLILLKFSFDRFSVAEVIPRYNLLDYLDRLATERQENEKVKP